MAKPPGVWFTQSLRKLGKKGIRPCLPDIVKTLKFVKQALSQGLYELNRGMEKAPAAKAGGAYEYLEESRLTIFLY
jgi:hypothetical protein